jgi:thiamine kinase-like enzyme
MLINKQYLTALLQQADEETADIIIDTCHGGGNNRVFILSNNERKLIVKWYYNHPSDTRNRLQAEYSFLKYTNKLGLSNVPKVLACLPEYNLALYEFIEGRKLNSSEISEKKISEAADFFSQINNPGYHQFTEGIHKASDACFSIRDHLISVQQRVKRLVDSVNQTDETVIQFAKELNNKTHDICNSIEENLLGMGDGLDIKLDEQQRCISPSDFGFHNALLQSSEQLCFIDFEYAGWDDPAKMICDFFCQPEIPADFVHFDSFVNNALKNTCLAENIELIKQRVYLLLPLHKIKWCCIILNEFIPQAAKRREFATADFDLCARKDLQIAKALTLFNSIQSFR